MSNIDLPLQEDVITVVKEVASVYLGYDVCTLPGAQETARPDDWVGLVGIQGVFSGAVSVTCSRQMATTLASSMLGIPTGRVTELDARDALAEFTNVVGGNVKSMLSLAAGETCTLSLPRVASGAMDNRKGDQLLSVVLFWRNSQVTIEIVRCLDQITAVPSTEVLA